MWTNVFRIGGLQHVSWFQFLPSESDVNSLPDKSVKVAQRDAATNLVLSAHLQLQNEGFLSTWTNSFVGPWDPSQGMHNPGTQSFNGTSSSSYLEGFSPVKALGSTPVSYVLIPSPSVRYLPPMPSQLPMCLTAESPPLAHLLHSKGSAIPLSTGFVVSKAVPTFHKGTSKDEWPSVLAVSLVDYYGGSNISFQDKMARGSNSKAVRSSSIEGRDDEMEIHLVLESAAAELHALSWMFANPSVLERRTALPFHCDIVLRLRRLLHYADKEFCQSPEKANYA